MLSLVYRQGRGLAGDMHSIHQTVLSAIALQVPTSTRAARFTNTIPLDRRRGLPSQNAIPGYETIGTAGEWRGIQRLRPP